MLKQRVLTALIGLPLLLWLLIGGPTWAIGMFFLLLVAIATYESMCIFWQWLFPTADQGRISPVTNQRLWQWLLPVVLAALFGAYLQGSLEWLVPALVGTLVVLWAAVILLYQEPGQATRIGMMLAFVMNYALWPWVALWELYQYANHAAGLIFVLAIVWSGDSAAYFGGKAWGRTKLAPHISPNKTVEGAVTGLIASAAAAWVAGTILSLSHNHIGLLLCGLFGGGLGQIGDLFESSLKRFGGVKDSGHLVPGHGGLLDRVDALLFAAPMIWFILEKL